MGGWRVHGVGAYTHLPMNSYNVKTFHFMNTHPPIKHIQSVTLSLYIYFRWFMRWEVGGGGMMRGFIGSVSGWWEGWLESSWGGWLEGSWGGLVCGGMDGGGVDGWRVHGVGAYTHPPIKDDNVKIFNFMNTHLPTHRTYPKCHSITIHILWMVHGVGGGWWWDGWLESSWGGWLEGSWGGCVWLWWGGWLEGSHGGCIYSPTHEVTMLKYLIL